LPSFERKSKSSPPSASSRTIKGLFSTGLLVIFTLAVLWSTILMRWGKLSLVRKSASILKASYLLAPG